MYNKSIIQKLKALNLRRFEIDLCLEILQYFKILKEYGEVSKKLQFVFPKNETLCKKFKVGKTLIVRDIKNLKLIEEIKVIAHKKYKFTETGEVQFYTLRKIILLENRRLKQHLQCKNFKKVYERFIEPPVLTKYELYLRNNSKVFCKSIKNVKLTLKYSKENKTIYENIKSIYKSTMFFN